MDDLGGTERDFARMCYEADANEVSGNSSSAEHLSVDI